MAFREASIVVLEDEALTSHLYRMIIRSMKHKLNEIVVTGEDLIISVELSPPDLIISDIKVKGEISGLTAIETIRKKYKIPVIFITALSDKETLEKIEKLIPCGVLIKPVFPNAIKDQINLCLSGHA